MYISDIPDDPRRLQDDWDAEARRRKLAALRGRARQEARLHDLAPALDRWTGRFAYAVIAATAALFAAHAVRHALRMLAA